MLSKPKRHKNSKESHLQNLYPTSLKQNPNAIRVKFSRYRQNQIFTNVSFDTLIFIGNCDFGVTKKNESSPDNEKGGLISVTDHIKLMNGIL